MPCAGQILKKSDVPKISIAFTNSSSGDNGVAGAGMEVAEARPAASGDLNRLPGRGVDAVMAASDAVIGA